MQIGTTNAGIPILAEQRRGCGFRKEGGIYLIGEGAGSPCCRLPIALDRCPTCGGGIAQTRGWTWVDLPALLAQTTTRGAQRELNDEVTEWAAACAACPRTGETGHEGLAHVLDCEAALVGALDRLQRAGQGNPTAQTDEAGAPETADLTACGGCPMAHPKAIGKAGLLWIGTAYYKTPLDFHREGEEMGLSRRIGAIPRGFKVGETWILLAHPKTVGRECDRCDGVGWTEGGEALQTPCKVCDATGRIGKPGIFKVWLPERIEQVVGADTTEEDADALRKRGITPVVIHRVEKPATATAGVAGNGEGDQ
jgi:hypothetical protein